MYKIFILILILKDISADKEESNEKYIDLLPEEEKQEFLNRIARRILEEIKSSYTPNESHADMTDDQLNTHNTYVQELLKEESQNLETERRRDSNKVTGESERDDINNHNKDEYIDLTLREGQRLKRRDSDLDLQQTTISELPYDVIPVQTIYDQIDNDDKNVRTGALMSFKDSITTANENKENLTDKNELITNYEEKANIVATDTESVRNDSTLVSLNNDENIQGLRKTYENVNSDTTVMIDFEPITLESASTTEYNEIDTHTPDQENVNITSNDETIWGSTKKIYVEDISSEKSDERTTLENNITTSSEISTFSKVVTSAITNTEINNVQSTTPYTDNVTNSEPSINARKKISDIVFLNETNSDENVYYSTQANEKELITSTTENYASELNYTIMFNVTGDISTSVKHEKHISNNYAKSDNISVTKSSDEDIDVKNVNDKIVTKEKDDEDKTVLRVRSDLFNESEMDDSDIFQRLDDSNQEAYEIYEVDPNAPHFIPSGKKRIHEHPHYIPVYNYASDNAYYRPYNKFGPNVQDSEENEFIIYRDKEIDLSNARHRFSSYKKEKGHLNNRDSKHLSKENNKKFTNFMKPISQTLVHNDIFYNPYDYPDVDYFGRILRRGEYNDDDDIDDDSDTNYKRFPDSNEQDHPFFTIHNSKTVKDHVRAVRRLLFLQKIFGFVPEQYGKRGRKAYSNLEDRNNLLELNDNINPGKNPREDSISMDYYFGRIDTNKYLTKNRAVRNNKSDFRLMYENTNFPPLTPNPLNLKPFMETKRSKMKLIDLNKKKRIVKSSDDANISFRKFFKAMLVVLKDQIKLDNEALIKYNWLKTTVDIQAALRKLLELISQIKAGEYIHPKDAELLKYVLYLFQSSKSKVNSNYVKEDDEKAVDLKVQRVKQKQRGKLSFFPKSKRKKIIKEPIKVWKEFTNYIRGKESDIDTKMRPNKMLQDFENFLRSLLFNLNDLHDTIKHIAMITKHNQQRWYQDLKDVFLKEADPKKLAEVVLHLSLSKLLDYIEASAANGLEDSFRIYLKKNREDVKRSKEESLFVFNVLNELERINRS